MQPAIAARLAGIRGRTAAPVEMGAVAASARALGWLPELSALSAAGLLLVALADNGARISADWAEPLFWLGLLVVFVPVISRLAVPTVGRVEALGLPVLLGLSLYLIKLLQSPLAFSFHDEFMHWRTLDDILQTGHLFTPNDLLPISAFYPSMEISTAALAAVGGLSDYSAGVMLIGVSRLVLMLALFLLYERISGSAQIAGLAAALYTANPNYIFFDAAFSYESLALSLLVLALLTTLAAKQSGRNTARGMILVGTVAVLSLVTAHHLTSYLLTGFLILWAVVDVIRHWGTNVLPGPLGVAVLAVVAVVIWTLSVAQVSLDYLGPPLRDAVLALMRLIGQEQAPRALFQQASGQVTPLWERLASMGAVGLILLGLPLGLRQIWRHLRGSSLALALALTALGYPASLALRFIGAGWEVANRSSEFIFLALSLVLATAVYPFLRDGRFAGPARGAFAAGAAVLVIGGLVIGWPPAWLVPGPYQVPVGIAGGSRSIAPEGVTVAEWARTYLGPDNMVGADETNMLLMSTYGGQHISTTLSGGQDINWVLFAPALGADQLRVLQRGRIDYLVVDYRQSTAARLNRHYYPDTDIGAALQKFDALPGVSRVMDSGNIAVFDVRGLRDGR